MRTLCIVALLAVTVPSVSSAQPPAPPRGFVGVGVVADNDRTWTNSAIVPAAAFVIGGDVNETLGVRFEWEQPPYVSSQFDVTSATRRIVQTERHRSELWSGLIDVHKQLTNRLRVAFVTGLTTAVRPEDYEATIDTPATRTTPASHTVNRLHRQFDWWGGLTAGGEAEIALARHVAIVPQVRLTSYPFFDETPGIHIFRGGVTVRLRF
jgi:hypothetical protein